MSQKQKKKIKTNTLLGVISKLNQKSPKIQFTKLQLITLLIGVFLIIIIIGIYFKYLISKEIKIIQNKMDYSLTQSNGKGTTQIIDNSATSPVILAKLKESGIERYFLSNVELMNNHYVPVIYLCLFKEGKPIYPLYVYETWALVNYPDDLSPKVALIKYRLLPEDNANFNLDKNCFIREIRTDNDWQEMEEKYSFSKKQFN